ncbi:scopoletin glucosyltransferase [Populus alba x Populus x berolinensis]|uniref:Scopoletin glucosyltransferase n=1 Tax=Populus alba x Populus x berolinensis TaxID=444605 RepID=A0AAD6MI91_9ROSI|nr:scopoletin glucosyltransferase [Populus alba x Populus x berolinensis]
MDSMPYQLHILFFPYMAHGHMIPTVDMARLFARRGVKATIVSTPLNAPLCSKTIERDRQLGLDISIHIIKFPSAEAGLPEGCENLSSIPSPDMLPNFLKAIGMLQQPLEQLLEECHPSCLVADMLFPWATEAANKLRIPRLFFNGTDSLKRYEPPEGVDSDFEPFVVPGLPDQIKLTRLRLPAFIKERTENELTKLMDKISESMVRSYGVLTNSFLELEPAYSEHYKMEIKRKTWHIGPLITDVLKIGIGVGAQEWSRYEKKIIVRKEDIEKAIIQLMVGEEAEEIRNRARVLKEMARRATKEGGSSYSDLTAFLEEL